MAMFGATGRVGATARARDGVAPPTSTVRPTTTAGAAGMGGALGAASLVVLVAPLLASFFSGTRFEKLIAERSEYQSHATPRSRRLPSMSIEVTWHHTRAIRHASFSRRSD
jgi:hypothetical protein